LAFIFSLFSPFGALVLILCKWMDATMDNFY